MRIFLVAAVWVCLSPLTARAEKALTIDIHGPGMSRVNMVLAAPMDLAGRDEVSPEPDKFQEYLKQNLKFLPFINLVPGSEILGGVVLDGVDRDRIDFNRFQLRRVDLVLTTGRLFEPGKPTRLECRVYEVFTGRLLVGRAYLGVAEENLARVADMFCASFMEKLTGNGDFFRSVLAFTKTEGQGLRGIWTVNPQGRGLRQVTFLAGSSVSPSWSKDGRYLVFGHHGTYDHTLGVWDAEQDRTFQVKLPGGTIAGAVFTPEGRVAVALSRGNMDIFLLTPELLKIRKTLVRSWAIDVSPSLDKSGKKMAFVSDRQGNPQVYVKNLETDKTRRVTYEGNYNTSPSLSPDGRLVAFSRRTKNGHRIFVHNLATSTEKQVTFGPGNDEEPAFAPDGYFLAFSSNRSGRYKIYLTTRHGGRVRMVPTGKGAATHPCFGPVRNP